MEIINKNKLTDIKSVVFYKSDGTKLKLLHSGKSNQISLDNYSQYDFSYLFEKGKYNGDFLINDLDKESKDLIGFGEKDITEFEKVLFPSLSTVTTESSGDYDYFGYLLLGEQKFYMFDIIPNSKYIILCDTFLKDDTTIPEGYSNYLDYLKDTYCYIQLNSDEISAFRKTLSICLGKDEDPKINLMYQLFLNDNKNPFRNANKVYLRNDDYYKESSNIDIIKEKTYSNGSSINKVFKYDRNSDVLLSNDECEAINYANLATDTLITIGSLGVANVYSIDPVNMKVINLHTGVSLNISKDHIIKKDQEFELHINFNTGEITGTIGTDSVDNNYVSTQFYENDLVIDWKNRKIKKRNREICSLNSENEFTINGIDYKVHNFQVFTINKSLLIYNRKKNNISQNQYDKHIRYNKGDLVIVNNERWISLVDNNLGNIPFYSSLWTREETLENIRLYRILISLVCNGRAGKTYNSGTLSKYGYITLRETDNNLVFSITLENGFSFDGIKLDGRTATENDDFTKTEIITSGKNVINLSFAKSKVKDIYSLVSCLKPEEYSLTISNSNSFDFDIYIDNELWIEEPVTTEESTQEETISKNLNVFNEDEIRIVPKDNRILNGITVISGNFKIKEGTVQILPQENSDDISINLDIVEAICKTTINNDPRIIVKDKDIEETINKVINIEFYSEDDDIDLYVNDPIKYTYEKVGSLKHISYDGNKYIDITNNPTEFTITYKMDNSSATVTKSFNITWEFNKDNIIKSITRIDNKYNMIAIYDNLCEIDFEKGEVLDSSTGNISRIVDNSFSIGNDNYILEGFAIYKDETQEKEGPSHSRVIIDEVVYTISWNSGLNGIINETIEIDNNNSFTIDNIIYNIVNNNIYEYYVFTSTDIDVVNNSFYLNAGILNKIDDMYTYTVVADRERVIELKVKEEGEII